MRRKNLPRPKVSNTGDSLDDHTAAGSHISTSNKLKTQNLQEKATAEALSMPFKLLLFSCFLPMLSLSWKVFSTGEESLRLGDLKDDLLICFAVSLFGFFLTSHMIPLVAQKLLPKLFGVDIGKRGLGGRSDGEKIPESLGIVSGFVLMLCIAILEVCHELGFMGNILESEKLIVEYHAALSSICFAILLGLVDDVIDIRWRHKVPIGFFMCMPLLLSYSGGTTVLVPLSMRSFMKELGALTWQSGYENSFFAQMLRQVFDLLRVEIIADGDLIDLGLLYYLYMFILIVFATNSINIYAGINGLEVGQSLIMGISVATVNLIEITQHQNLSHLFSLMLMLPFIFTSMALLRYNFYPASVFVGDVYPYYAGMSLAVAAILGHFPKSLLLLMIPQLLNFLYSLPQLMGLVPCPRHRLPRIDLKTGFLNPSKVKPGSKKSNMTLLCFFLDIFGPLHERTLCIVLLVFQVACSIVGIGLRSVIAQYC